MRPAAIFSGVIFLLLAATDLRASGPVGVLGIIEKVVFEPDEKSPERIQVWGAFAFVEGSPTSAGATSMPKRGYFYFKLPRDGQQLAAAKNEWADLRAVAGTGQAVGFGNWGLIGAFSALDSRSPSSTLPYLLELYPGGGSQTEVRVRPASEPPANPAGYSTNAGIVKLTEASHARIIKQLKEVLNTR
jgi:hypothetical protein